MSPMTNPAIPAPSSSARLGEGAGWGRQFQTRDHARHPARRQGGAVIILVALSIAILVGFLGLVVDLAHLFVTKTETQGSADACALAAARELTGDPMAVTRAENAGTLLEQRNNVNFQTTPATNVAISFSDQLSPNSAYLSSLSANPATTKYAMCTLSQPGIAPWFMEAMGFGAQTVSAMAVATLAPSQTNCAIPLGLCLNASPPASCPDGSAPDTYGLCVGDWRGGKFGSGGGVNGAFNWLQFPGQASGAQGVIDALTGPGNCDLARNDTVPAETGNLGNAGGKAWNSRFGLNQPACTPPNCPTPDFTGYSYTSTNWTSQRNALPDFLIRRGTNAPYEGDAITGLSLPGGLNSLSSSQLAAYGADRRLVTVPIVDCSAWSASHQAQLLDFACVLMLYPVDTSGNVSLEYRGLSSLPGSPCATSGLGGGTVGPLVPVLVQ
ncbi:MAG: pilus assembly protein TadG-related protein [Sulfuricella sp.]|nr:pilus assembly protein TadG-related protein [Sulfuricella sp.]